MTVAIYAPSATERDTARRIQETVEKRIATECLTPEDLASRLGMLPEGVQNLRARIWSPEVAWRVAEAIGIPVHCDL